MGWRDWLDKHARWRRVIRVAGWSVLLLPWALLAVLLIAALRAGTTTAIVRHPIETLVAYQRVEHNQGPWGHLQIEPIIVEAPLAFFSPIVPPPAVRQWVFRDMALERIKATLERVGLPADDIQTLVRTARAEPAINGFVVEVPDAVQWNLPSATRAALYLELARSRDNMSAYANPCFFRGRDIDEWFANSQVPDAIVRQLRPLVYREDRTLFIADVPLILPRIESPIDRMRLLRALKRAAALSVKLRIEEEQDVADLIAYWGVNGRTARVESLLESSRHQPGGTLLDIVYLLPPFARTRLNTYINPTRSNDGVRRDCHWTSFNFFTAQPDDRFGGDVEAVMALAGTRFDPVSPPLQFGDVILLTLNDEVVIHSCNYIADNIVFTKNGSTASAPFVLDRLDDVLTLYRLCGPVAVQYMRHKPADLIAPPPSSREAAFPVDTLAE